MKTFLSCAIIALLCSCGPSGHNKATYQDTSQLIASPIPDTPESEPDFDLEPPPKGAYSVLSFTPTTNSISSKNQIDIRAYYNTKNPTKEQVESYLRELNKDAMMYEFKKEEEIRDIVIFIYSSKRKANSNHGAWDAKLTYREPDIGPPVLTFSDKYDNSSERAATYREDVALFNSKGADFCEAYRLFEKANVKAERIINSNVFQADTKAEHYLQGVLHKYLSKHGLNDSLQFDIADYGGIFCR